MFFMLTLYVITSSSQKLSFPKSRNISDRLMIIKMDAKIVAPDTRAGTSNLICPYSGGALQFAKYAHQTYYYTNGHSDILIIKVLR